MRILVVGGTAFVGRAIVRDAVARGHDVTVINRGVTPSDLPDGVERLVGDRHQDLRALDGRAFDATVDVIAYRASDVDRLADALGDRGGHHLQISSISAYQDPIAPGSTEDDATLWPDGSVDPEAPIDGTTYGPLKAAAEYAALRRFGETTAIVRPTYVIGAHDLTMRFPYWVARCARGGDVAVPGSRSATLQYVDARDLAAFCVRILEHGRRGPFHACGPFPAEGFLTSIERIAAHASPPGTRLVELDSATLAAAGREGSFPLWSGPDGDGALAMDPARALASGLALRPIEASVDDVLAWWGEREWPAHWLTPEDEASLLQPSSPAPT
jgi:2'-hydroxyisoflavone reductase